MAGIDIKGRISLGFISCGANLINLAPERAQGGFEQYAPDEH